MLLDRRGRNVSSEFCGYQPDREMFVVRYSSMGECARAKSFFDSQITHLKLLNFDDAMERIAGAVPVCMLHLIWTCVLDQQSLLKVVQGKVGFVMTPAPQKRWRRRKPPY